MNNADVNPELSQLIEDLKAPVWQKRIAAAIALSESGAPAAAAIPALWEALRRAEAEPVRMIMAQVLVKLGVIEAKVSNQEVVPTAEIKWAKCSRKMKYGADPALTCETDYCCVDMVVSHNWPNATVRAPECTNQEMIEFITGLQTSQLSHFRHVFLDEILQSYISGSNKTAY